MLVVVLLCGCTSIDSDQEYVVEQDNEQNHEQEYNSELNRFVGVWQYIEDVGWTGYNRTMILFSDGTGELYGFFLVWELKDGKLVIYQADGLLVYTYDYLFSNNDTKLTLTTVSGDTSQVYIKQD